MENLEKYIQDNLEQFNKGEMPAGHQERFLAKLEALQSREQHQEPKPHHLPIRKQRIQRTLFLRSLLILIKLNHRRCIALAERPQ